MQPLQLKWTLHLSEVSTLGGCHFVSSDYSSGFGGKYGLQADLVDKSAVGFDYQGKTEKHESQKGAAGSGSFVHTCLFLLSLSFP